MEVEHHQEIAAIQQDTLRGNSRKGRDIDPSCAKEKVQNEYRLIPLKLCRIGYKVWECQHSEDFEAYLRGGAK